MTRLRVDYLDLLLIHWPGVAKMDVKSIRNAHKRLETWRVVEELYRAGRCKAVGVSNYEEGHLAELLEVAEIRPMVNQVGQSPSFLSETFAQIQAKLRCLRQHIWLTCNDLLTYQNNLIMWSTIQSSILG